MSYQIIIHGGANDLTEEAGVRRQACEEIVSQAECWLVEGKSALETCEFAVNLLEDNILFNAGTGSYLQIDGQIRMDASMMTSRLELGAVIQIPNVKNPISVARKILETGYHSTLSGEGARTFALENGFPPYNPVTEKQYAQYFATHNTLKGDISYRNLCDTFSREKKGKLGTVGCVVRDSSGLIVAGTSTGGLKVCFPGRVGDSPMVGAGNYANEYCGVSCTGIGEKIMRLTLARMVTWFVENGQSLEESCNQAIERLGQIEGDGGLIAVSAKSEIAFAFNTKTMSYAMRKGA